MSNEIFICDICRREFKSKRSLTSHINHHDESYHIKSINGALSSHSKCKVSIDERYQKRIDVYNNSPNKCIACLVALEYRSRTNKFCSHKCAAIYSN